MRKVDFVVLLGMALIAVSVWAVLRLLYLVVVKP